MKKRKSPPWNFLRGNPLKPVCVTGLVLALVISWALVLFAVIWGDIPAGEGSGESPFAAKLREYDLYDAPKKVMEGERPESIEARLMSLQNQAGGIEERLSVLKRRRVLALIDRRYIASYEQAATEAADAFPYSSPLAAVAADALVIGGVPASAEAVSALKKYGQRISQNRFEYLELGIHVLSGDLENPRSAAGIDGLQNMLSADTSGFPGHVREAVLVDSFLLSVLGGDISGASMKLNSLLSALDEFSASESGMLMRMGAEFYYDHGNPVQAAEIFSRLATDNDLSRAADALVLAGETAGARNIWLALSSEPDAASNQAGTLSTQIRSRSLYNLAASSDSGGEETSWLEKLFAFYSRRRFKTQDESAGIYGIIRYTRLMDTGRAVAVLADESFDKALLDLELLRRRLDTWPPTRSAAEVWLLLERNPGEEAVYEWAAWYFDRQKLYAETERLLKEAGRRHMKGTWIDLHRGLAFVREGKIDEGESLLREAAARSKDWRIGANLGRIQESRRSISNAVEFYEDAARLSASYFNGSMPEAERASSARLQMRLSRCFEALGMISESRHAAEYALELDPDNLNIKREIRRLNNL